VLANGSTALRQAAPTRMVSASPFFGRYVVGVHALGCKVELGDHFGQSK